MEVVLYAKAAPKLAKKVAEMREAPAVEAEIGPFEDGEDKLKLHLPEKTTHVITIQSTYPPHYNLIHGIQMLSALKEGGVPLRTYVYPYYGYGREDKQFTEKGMAALSAVAFHDAFQAQKPTRTIAVDLHNPAATPKIENLLPTELFAEDIKKRLRLSNLAVCVPDKGAKERSEDLARALGLDASRMIVYDKERDKETGKISLDFKKGDVEGKTVVLYDDIMASGGTAYNIARDLKERGANKVVLYCTHGVLCGKAFKRLMSKAIDKLVISDSIPLKGRKLGLVQRSMLSHLRKRKKLEVVSLAPLIAEALK